MTIDTKRQLTRERQTAVDFGGDSLKDLQKLIKDLIDVYGPDAYIDGECDPYSDSEQKSYYVYTKVFETDAEMNARIERQQRVEANRDARDLAEFQRLSAKFSQIVDS